MALAAIDMALWDALARLHGVPLVSLLGGVATASPRVRRGWVRWSGALCARSRSLGGAGLHAASRPRSAIPRSRRIVAVIRAMRSAAGRGVAIMVDYNQSLTPAEAVSRLRVLDDEGLEWVEEPTLAHDYAGHALVAREARTPIQCGENWWGVRDLQHAIAAAASDYVMPDVMKIGGVTGWLRGAALADAHGLRVSSHLWPEMSAHLLVGDADGALAGVRGLVESDPARAVAGDRRHGASRAAVLAPGLNGMKMRLGGSWRD